MKRLISFFHKDDNPSHNCSLVSIESTILPPLPNKQTLKQKVFGFLWKIPLISEHNPQSMEYFRSRVEILRIRQQQIQSQSCIIHPFSDFRAFYEMCMSLIWFLILLYVPAQAAFEITNAGPRYLGDPKYQKTKGFINALDILVHVLGVVDIIFTFCTGYLLEKRRKVVMRPMKIFKHYVVSVYFLPDVVCSIPFKAFMTRHADQQLLSMLGFLRIVRLPTLYSYVTRTFEILKLRHVIFEITKHVLLNYLLFHWFACLHYMIPQIRYILYGQIMPVSWVERADFGALKFFEKYAICMYRAVGNLFCILFEKRNVVTWEEILLAMITFIFGKMYTFYLVVLILNYLFRQSSLEIMYYETISQVKAYMTKKHLSIATQTRILQFYDYKYNRRFFKERNIMGLLSDKLRGEINLNVCSKLVQNVALLAQLSKEQLEQVVLNLKAEIYLANDIIIRAGSVGDCMYFLASGTVSVWTPSGKEVCHLQDGAYFGEISLVFKDKRRTANIVAIEICEVYKLDRKTFRNIVKANPDLLKMMEEVAMARIHITQKFEEEHAKTFMELSSHHNE